MINIRELTINDYEAAISLWKNTQGVCNCDKCTALDSKENIEKFLKRNKGLSFAAEENGELKGVVLCGHDGRTGLIYRLTVTEELRKRNIGRKLVNSSVEALRREGLTTVKAFVLNDNDGGNAFWDKIGFGISDIAVTRGREV
ncbi:MAG: GNAT family N-acetyltransferase [Oscillospiraceae bacterium]|nr:GNAT family N-acetyltransferase [Oscillospiraceae bacterium]